MTLKRGSLALLGLLLVAPVVFATWRQVQRDKAFALVRAAATAHEHVGYAGEVGWRKARWGKSVTVAHDATSGRTRYRWGKWFAYTTERPSSRSPDPAAWCLDLEALEDNYHAEELDPVEFLGRRARHLVLTSRYEGRPSVHLTIDAGTNLPLKIATYAPDGTLCRVAAFKKVKIGPQAVEKSRRPRAWSEWFGKTVAPAAAAKAVDFEPMIPDYLPEGFRLIDSRVSGHGVLKRLRLVYSDGLTTFELEQGIVPTPAQKEADYERRFGKRKVEWFMRQYLRHCRGWIIRSEGAGGKTTVTRHSMGRHRVHQLVVDRVEVKLTSRSDLAADEPIRVLQSLRTH